MKNENKKRKLWVKLLIGVLIVILLLLMAAVGTVEYVLGKIGSALPEDTQPPIPPELEDFETDPVEDVTLPVVVTPTEPTKGTEPTEPTQETEPEATVPSIDWPTMEELKDDQVVNILLIGQDTSIAQGRSRSDTMILLSINKRTNSISLTSFMRDLYVSIPGYSDNRINAAYRFGGAPLLNSTLRKNFGIVVDGNVAVGLDQFAKIVDILGGVDVELTAKEANHMRSQGHTSVHEGMNHLNGTQTLAFCRIRKIDSDHNRTERQRRVLISIASAARNAGAGQVMSLVNEVLPYVSTDLSNGQIISYATSAMSILSGGGSVRSGKVPQSNDYSGEYIRGMQVMVPNLWRCYEYLKSFIYGW